MPKIGLVLEGLIFENIPGMVIKGIFFTERLVESGDVMDHYINSTEVLPLKILIMDSKM